MLSAVVGRGLPSCGGRPLWGFSASRVLLGLLGGGGAVLFCMVSAFKVSSIVGTVRSGRLSAAFRRAGWGSGAGWSLGVAFRWAEACGFADGGHSHLNIYDINFLVSCCCNYGWH